MRRSSALLFVGVVALTTLAITSVSATQYTMIDLGTLGGTAAGAGGINNSGQVVGDSRLTGDASSHAFLWQNGSRMRDLGTLGGSDSYAIGINDSGQVVGFSLLTGNSHEHAFLWQNGAPMHDLGMLGGTDSGALGINDSGLVAGWASDATGVRHAVVWAPVCEPPSLLALLCGLAGIGGMMWRRRR